MTSRFSDHSPAARGRIVPRLLPALAWLVILAPAPAQDQPKLNPDRLAWWRDARLGLFIHWGPVSLKGTEIGWSRGEQVPVEEYDNLYKQFNPTAFDADEWVRLARDAGMKYVVITSKHHDGFCLWDSQFTDYDIMATPFKRDVLVELAAACRKHGLKFCVYYSVLDWHHPDYPTDSPGGKTLKPQPNLPRYFEYMKNQLREIQTKYGPLGLIWFDGEWEQPWTLEYGRELEKFVRELQPDVIINNRVGKNPAGGGTSAQKPGNPGDYDCPEQRIGGFNRERPWETCMTICQQWAWKPDDKLKSLEECLHALVRAAGGDGNFLFNVGPMPDGRVEPRQVERLREMGDWLKRNGESIYGTRGGPFMPNELGASTCKGDKIYVHVLRWPEGGGALKLPPIPRKILKAEILGGDATAVDQDAAGIKVAVSEASRREIDTIVVLTCDGPTEAIEPVAWPVADRGAGKQP